MTWYGVNRYFHTLLLMLCIIASIIPADVIAIENTKKNILSGFKDIGVDSRPMARMWFPDAGAGADKNDLIALQINAMAKGGFGGVEIAMLADETTYTTEQAKVIGWGTENWKNVLKKTLRAANSVKDGFKVDITITAHWPPIINTIDPNDREAAKELSCNYVKVKGSDIIKGAFEIPLPTQKTSDGKRHTFYFTDELIDAYLIKATGTDSKGGPILDFDSVIRLTDKVEKYGGKAAGIPDDQTSEDAFGKRPENSNFQGKINSKGLRKRMADWQYSYEVDLRPFAPRLGKLNDDAAVSADDWVLLATYCRGTGQVLSGGGVITMYGGHYVTDYFSKEGIRKVLDFWNARLLSDPELLAMLKENGSRVGASIFEDSIEASHSGPFWTCDLLKKFDAGYKYLDRISLVVALSSASEPRGGFPMDMETSGRGEAPAGMEASGRGEAPAGMDFFQEGEGPSFGNLPMGEDNPFGSGGPPGMGQQEESKAPAPVFEDKTIAARIVQDYNIKLGELYAKEHASVISKWASTFNYTYRAQGYTLTGLDVAGAAAALDIPEGDNATSGDGLRNLSSAVNLYDKKFLSMEAITVIKCAAPWANIVKELNSNFSHGVNRVILHGSGYAKTFDNNHTKWPGWGWGGMNVGVEQFTSWNQRQIYWEDVNIFSDYVSRNQNLLQNGTAKVDLAVINNTSSSFNILSGNSMQDLLDKGYSYNILSEAILNSEHAVVSKGRLYAEGPAYKALVLNNATTLSVGALKKIISFADAGLPVIILGDSPKTVYGTEINENNDRLLQDLVEQLKNRKTAASAAAKEDIATLLDGFGVKGSAAYDLKGLETSHIYDKTDGTDYYYLYNSGNNIINTEIPLEGKGAPYVMDAWTGEILPVPSYTVDEGYITVPLSIVPRESKIIALASSKTSKFSPAVDPHVLSASGGSVLYRNGKMFFQTNDPGKYMIRFSDGTEKTLEIKDSIPPIDLSAGGWDLKLYSFGPDDSPENLDGKNELIDPTRSKRTLLSYKNISLVPWTSLPASNEQLAQLGTIFKKVTGMKDVSGIGNYSRIFTLPAGWKKENGASLIIGHGEDMITRIVVNGHVMDKIDQLNDIFDIGGYLNPGENSIEIKLDTTVKNRISLEVGAPQQGRRIENTGNTDNGIISVTIIPCARFIL